MVGDIQKSYVIYEMDTLELKTILKSVLLKYRDAEEGKNPKIDLEGKLCVWRCGLD